MRVGRDLKIVMRPASSGPVRYWQDRIRLAAKAALAAAAAWALAKYAADQPDPYFAPLAALLGVYPTMARSLREGIQYVAGFAMGAALAIPASLLLGSRTLAIAIVVLIGMLVGSCRRLGDHSLQVTFTALFGLLLGGQHPLGYIVPRMADVGIGVTVGLAVNLLVFPPLQLRPAEQAVQQLGSEIAAALEDLAEVAADPHRGQQFWVRRDARLSFAADRARAATSRAQESLRWNPRAKSHHTVPRPNSAVVHSLEELTMRTRAVARSLLDTTAEDGSHALPATFRQEYAAILRGMAGEIRQLANQRSPAPNSDTLTCGSRMQQSLENQACQLPHRSDVWSIAHHMTRLSGEALREVRLMGRMSS